MEDLRALLGSDFRLIAGMILGLGLVKGIGNYFSVFLMADVGQRLVRDLRNELFGTSWGNPPASSRGTRPAV